MTNVWPSQGEPTRTGSASGRSAPASGLTGGDVEISFDDLDGSILGQALCVVSGGTSEIASATMVLDTGVTDQDDQQNIAAHEIGHAIGLLHKGRPGTLMHRFFFEGLEAYLPLADASRRWIARNY